jgi:hypothetical protein
MKTKFDLYEVGTEFLYLINQILAFKISEHYYYYYYYYYYTYT